MNTYDERIVYGANCAWWDSIDKVGKRSPHSFPCCPICGGVLFEMRSEAEWFTAVDVHDVKEPGYRKFVEWNRGKCFPNYATARKAYSEEMKLL